MHVSDYGYLKLAASEAIAAREVLRNSYIAGFSLPWGDRRRSGPRPGPCQLPTLTLRVESSCSTIMGHAVVVDGDEGIRSYTVD